MLRFAIAGTGRISDWILRGALMDPRFKAVAVCSRSEESAKRFIASHPEAFSPEAKIFTSIDELASAGGIDAVYIGTPNSTHLRYASACLEGGKHVLCEKPLAATASEASMLRDIARRNGRLLMEAMISTLNPNFRAAAEAMEQITPVRSYVSSYCQYSTKYEDLKRGITANSLNPRMAGGAIMDIGIYTVYPMVALFGMPKEITARAQTVETSCGLVDIGGSVLCSYDGMTANLLYSKAIDSRLGTEIAGERGNIILDEIHICRRASLYPHAAPSSGRGERSGAQILSEGLGMDEYYYEFKHFIDLAEAGIAESPVNRLDVSVATLEVIDEVRRQTINSLTI